LIAGLSANDACVIQSNRKKACSLEMLAFCKALDKTTLALIQVLLLEICFA
jgi:hypothetical protein